MQETPEGVEGILDRPEQIDTTATFHTLWGITVELMEKITARFDVTRDPGTEQFESYGGETEHPSGHLAAFTGPELDWLVHSWIGNPPSGFTTMHLTAWLGPHIDVPHIGIAWGTLPDLWFSIDYIPRSDLMLDTESLDKYYAPLDRQFHELCADEGLRPFTSEALYVRQALSEVAACHTTDTTRERLDQIRELVHDRVDRWLGYVDEAVPVPEDRRAQLAADDLARRRTLAERDPANIMAVRFFGEELTGSLVRARWGGDRQIPRPSEP